MKIKLADFLWIFYGVREKWIKRQKKNSNIEENQQNHFLFEW